jgi:hypothetical protein
MVSGNRVEEAICDKMGRLQEVKRNYTLWSVTVCRFTGYCYGNKIEGTCKTDLRT